jgi:hypothetical protein
VKSRPVKLKNLLRLVKFWYLKVRAGCWAGRCRSKAEGKAGAGQQFLKRKKWKQPHCLRIRGK